MADRNKGIARIRYNHLRLPQAIVWQSGDSLQFRYSAAGQKLAKLAYAVGQPVVQTDYLGPWQYERDTLRWLSHAEGRVLRQLRPGAGGNAPTVHYVREYTIKDHLGNLRAAVKPGQTFTYEAWMDTNDAARQAREQQEFDSVSVSAPIRVSDPQFARTGDGVARVRAGGLRPTPIGPFKQLAVAKGDRVSLEAFGLYQQPTQDPHWAFSVAGFVASLLQQPAAAPVDGPHRRRVLPLLSVGLALVPAVQQLPGGVPKAYVRLLVYDQDSNLVARQSQTLQLTDAARDAYQQRTLSVTVEQGGYVQAYVANEGDTEVYFDDIKVVHQQGLQVQETQYDPYGLELAGLNRGFSLGLQNKYTWNGKERQDEFGLRWLDHGWRFFDPQLGRWVVVDPGAEEADQEGWTTYQFGLDNAVRYNDLDGRKPGDPEAPTVAGMLYNTAAGLAASVFNTAMFGSEVLNGRYGVGLAPRASVGDDGSVQVSNRMPAGNLREAAANLGSDALDGLNVASLAAGGGAGGVVKGGLLMAKAGGKVVATNAVAQAGKKAVKAVTSGDFSVSDWSGYPQGKVPKPAGPFKLLQGNDYTQARQAANNANRKIHRQNPKLKGLQIHEVQPVKFGGSPTDPANKVALPPGQHRTYSEFWDKLQRSIEK